MDPSGLEAMQISEMIANGSVVTGSNADFGGDSSSVTGLLQDGCPILSTEVIALLLLACCRME